MCLEECECIKYSEEEHRKIIKKMKEEEMKEQVKFISECGMYMDLEY
jgi:hypothetical protein